MKFYFLSSCRMKCEGMSDNSLDPLINKQSKFGWKEEDAAGKLLCATCQRKRWKDQKLMGFMSFT